MFIIIIIIIIVIIYSPKGTQELMKTQLARHCQAYNGACSSICSVAL